MPTANNSKDQYHHYIPRFILRRYKVPGSSSTASTSETAHTSEARTRKHGRKRARSDAASRANQDQVHFFDLSTCQLEIRPISRVYGTVNLYRDAANPENANHLEEKLSKLENDASVVVKQIHDVVESQSQHQAEYGRRMLKINRKSLETLRKFLFIMFYRHSCLSGSYYDDARFVNASLAAWLKRVKRTKGLESQADVWIHFLEYFLSTPHQEIISRAAEAQKEYGIMGILSGYDGLPEEAMDNFPAIDYTSLCGAFFMGIVEAADGTEFVLSDNSFGLWEGTVMGTPNIHRLFIVSPHIALLLRSNMPIAELSPFLVNSAFIDISIEPAQVEYADGKESMEAQEFMEYRLSALAQKDLYHFKIVKLTKAQTEEVNKVVLVNARVDSGSITFLTKEIMLETLRVAMTEPADVQLKNKLKVLMEGLANEQAVTNSDPLAVVIAAVQDKLRISTGTRMMPKAKMPDSDSGYDQAYRRYSDASVDEPGGQDIFDVTDYLVEQFRKLQLPTSLLEKADLTGGGRMCVHTDPYAALTETLTVMESVLVMDRMKEILACVNDQEKIKHSRDTGLYEAAIVGLLDWLVKNKGDVVKVLFPDVELVKKEMSKSV